MATESTVSQESRALQFIRLLLVAYGSNSTYEEGGPAFESWYGHLFGFLSLINVTELWSFSTY